MLDSVSPTDLADKYHPYHFFLVMNVLTEAVCVSLLLFKKAWRVLPLLTTYLGFMSIADTLGGLVYVHGTTNTYWVVFLAVSGAEYCFQIAVLCELAYLILKELGPGIFTRRLLGGMLIMTLVCVAIASGSACMAVYRLLSNDVTSFLHFDLGFSIFRVLILMLILYGAMICTPSVNSRVVHLAAYLSVYSVVALLAESTREYLNPHINPYGYFEISECMRMGSWCLSMILISGYVLTQEKSIVRDRIRSVADVANEEPALGV